MAIAFDAVTEHRSASADVSSTSFSHAVGAGSDRMLVVAVSWIDETTTAGNPSVSALTYNGVALTFRARARVHYAGDSRAVITELWTLAAPATGANTVSITLSEAIDGNNELLAVAASYTGVGGVGGTVGTNTGNSQNPTVTFTTGAATSLIVGAFMIGRADASRSGEIFTPGTGTTERAEHWSSSSADEGTIWLGEESASGGSDTIDASTSEAGNRWAMAAIELTEAAGGAVTVNANVGVVNVTGPQATIIAPLVVEASAGVVSVTGPQASIVATTTISAAVGVVDISGPTATIIAPRVISASAGVISVVGNQASIVSGLVLVQANVGVILVTGPRATIDTARYLYDLTVGDALAYSVVVGDAGATSMVVGDEAVYTVELGDASRA